MGQFGFTINPEKKIIVKEGDTQAFGKHTFAFVNAPMVHWPEVIVSFDTTSGVLFSADAFGTFGALNGRLFNDEVDFDRDWLEPARRYYTNIVGKYGAPVQMLLKKAAKLPIKMIAPLHGPVWRSNLAYFIDKYDKWSSYTPEEKGVLIVYGSMYGNTENAAEILAGKLVEKGITNVRMYDVSKTHVSYLISETFKYSHLVIASVTYNLGIYPPMLNYLHDMAALAVQKRTVAIVGNGSWAPMAAGKIAKLIGEMKNMTLLEARPAVTSSVTKTTDEQLEQLADGLVASVKG
jgi:flavorubredoxin